MDAPGASQEALAVDVGEAIGGEGRKVQVLGRRPGPRARRAVDACESHRRLVRAAVADVWGLAALDDASSHEGRHGDGVVRQARFGLLRNARAATATRGSRLRTPLRGDEGYRDESADLSIHQSGEILSNTLVIQGKLANEL